MLPPEATEPELRLRMIAAGWFAGAACIPVIFFFVIIVAMEGLPRKNLVFGCFFLLLPVLMGAFFGFLIGSRILNERIVTRSWSAIRHGVLVAILSYVGFMLIYTALAGLNASGQNPHFINYLIAVWVIGAILVGWLIIIAGAIEGWLLFRTRDRFLGRQLIASKKVRPIF
jgi:hypothetical protein